MPGKMIPAKGRGPKGATKKPKGKGMPGDQYAPKPTKPTKSRRKFLNQLNKMNKEAGY
jgi:hypothetical protein